VYFSGAGPFQPLGVYPEKSMANKNDKHNVVHVVMQGDQWATKKTHAERASSLHDLQSQAIKKAKQLAGRGEVIVHGRNGKIRKLTPFD